MRPFVARIEPTNEIHPHIEQIILLDIKLASGYEDERKANEKRTL